MEVNVTIRQHKIEVTVQKAITINSGGNLNAQTELNPDINTNANYQGVGIFISKKPNGTILVIVDGSYFARVGDGVKNKDCYFSVDDGTTALLFSEIPNDGSAELCWNGDNAQIGHLATTNRIDIIH